MIRSPFCVRDSVAAMAVMASVVAISCAQPAVSDGPPRPPGLPIEAFWIGGADGGAFVRVISDSAAAPYRGAVYHEDGTVWYEGSFRLEPAGETVDLSDRTAFTGWDGTRILLTRGRSLIAQAVR